MTPTTAPPLADALAAPGLASLGLPCPALSSGLPTAALDALASPLLDPLFQRPARTGIESAWFGHVPFAHWIAAAAAPRVLVELGTHYGASYFAFCDALARHGIDARAYAVDTWEGDPHAGRYGEEVFESVRRFHDERFRGFSTLLRRRFDEALDHFADGSIDLLHIDGFHTYEAVRDDWESWRPKLSDRAVALFHDTNERAGDFGVWRFWAELRERHPSFEFLHSHGLGVLACGPRAPPAVAALCGLTDARTVATVRERFALLGERWVEAEERAGNLAAQRRAEASLAGNEARLGAAQAELDRLRAEQDRHGSQAQRADELDRYLEATRAELTRSQAEADALRRQAAHDAAGIERLQGDLAHAARQAARLGEVAAERERLRAELQALTATSDREAAEMHDLRHRHQAVTRSVGWRAGAPLRGLGRRFPRLAAGGGRAMRLGALAASGRLPRHLRVRNQVRMDADTLRGSPLFDPADYLARHRDVARSGADPLWHYIWTGAAAGYDPHPLFSSRWYLARHPELAAAGVNPLAHYVREGAAAGHDPHPLFDTAFYVGQEPEAAGGNALLHYLEVGAARSRDPNPWFDTDGYWEDYVRDSGLALEPLTHYVLRGAAEGCDPCCLFDTDWYRDRYPDCGGRNPLEHFLAEGREAGHAPCLLLAQTPGEPPPLRFTPAAAPDVSIVVPAYGRLFDTLRCLYAIMLHSGDAVRYEVIVADDKPAAPIAPRLRAVPGLHVEANPANLGFLRSCNRAAGAAAGRHLLLLNNDTSVHPGWLAPLVRLADADPRVAIVGAKLLNADGTVQEAGGTVLADGWGDPFGRGQDADAPAVNFVREVDVVIGACMLVRRAAWDAVGGFDDQYAPAYYEEFDLAFALRARGWRVMYQPASAVTHFDASSYGAAERDHRSTVNHARFCRKWAEALTAQPRPGAPALVARARPPAGGRVLFIDDRVPEPDKHAGSVSTLHWLRRFRELGFAVTFAPHDQDHPQPYTAALGAMGIEVLYGPTDLPAWLAENGRFLDHVWSARPDVTEPLLDAIDRHARGRMIYFTHDLHSLREQRRHAVDGDPAALADSRRLHRIEREIFRRSRLVITPSADELPVIRAMAPGVEAMAVPLYSVPAAPLAPAAAERFDERDALLFVGGYAHRPNVDAALWLAREIMPLVWQRAPAARLVLVGSKPPAEVLALAGPRVEVTGWVADLGPAYAAARASINPLRYGAGVKGKVIEALQHGVPVITTPVGNEGIGLEAGSEGLIGATADALAAHAAALLEDAGLCARLAERGAAVIRRRFDEDAARRTLMRVLGIDLCPCCGRRAEAPCPVLACDACGADAAERALAEAAIRPWRGAGVASLREAAPLLAGSNPRAPEGPLAEALGAAQGAGAAGDEAAASGLVIARTQGGAGLDRLRPGGRLVCPADGDPAALVADGWTVRLHEAGPAVMEAEKPGAAG